MTPGGARGHGLRVHDGLVSTHLALALAALAATMACAVLRPRGIPEAAVAVAGAALVVVTGGLGPSAALDEARELGPTLAFLAAILVMGAMAERDGLFRAAGGLLARRAGRSPTRLLGLVVVVASLVTAVLSLDATVVLLTPVVVATTAALAVAPRPHTHACVHLANSASLLLPVSNLSNLLALRASGLSFPRFAALMALPWMAAIAVEWVGLRRLFARDLAAPAVDAHAGDGARAPVPRFALLVIALTLAGFLVEGPLGIDPAVVAAAGALALAVPALRRGRARPCWAWGSSCAPPGRPAWTTPSPPSCRPEAPSPPWSGSRRPPPCWRTSSTTCRRSSSCCPPSPGRAPAPCSPPSSGSTWGPT